MTDINHTTKPFSFTEDELRQSIELIFYAYRDFTAEPDAILAEYGFGRAHHRVIYFVGRNPGINVSELLFILRVTKQSLSRVLSQLVKENFIMQRQGSRDRRQRLLELSEKGEDLERRLTQTQREIVARAYLAAGEEAVKGYHAVLRGIINKGK